MKTILISITLLFATTISAQDKYDIFMAKMGVKDEAETIQNI